MLAVLLVYICLISFSPYVLLCLPFLTGSRKKGGGGTWHRDTHSPRPFAEPAAFRLARSPGRRCATTLPLDTIRSVSLRSRLPLRPRSMSPRQRTRRASLVRRTSEPSRGTRTKRRWMRWMRLREEEEEVKGSRCMSCGKAGRNVSTNGCR